MTNPVLVEVTRGARVESVHRGAVVVADSRGQQLFSLGDTQTPVFPRSAVKAMQALLLVESGAADRYGFGDRELALACASHSGEPLHADLAASMLAAAGHGETALECGCHWPSKLDVALDLARAGSAPTQLHNNCSGKHAGFVCAACHLGIDPAGYVRYGHDVQDMIRGIFADLTGDHFGVDNCGTDGCSIPTYATPLPSLARGFARMATGEGLATQRAAASRRIIEACMAEPYYVAGEGRTDTDLMRAAPGLVFAKTGAEGVYCAALPDRGLGIALKCDDGGTRAAEAMVAAVLAAFMDAGDRREAVRHFTTRPLKNWNGIDVGNIRVTAALDVN